MFSTRLDETKTIVVLPFEIKDVIVEYNFFLEIDLLTCGDLNFDLN